VIVFSTSVPLICIRGFLLSMKSLSESQAIEEIVWNGGDVDEGEDRFGQEIC
jgi:hypothetical protein